MTHDTLEAGAVDFMVKRPVSGKADRKRYADEIIRKVKGVARARVATKESSA